MRKFKASFLTTAAHQIQYVFTPEQLREIAEITELRPGMAGIPEVENGSLKDVEVLFSTWGFPRLDDAQLAKMPNLKAVFYAAGATDGFARPCFARGIKVFSAWRANGIPVAEFCLGQILLGLKGYFRTSRMFNSPDAKARQYAGPGIYGETVVLIFSEVVDGVFLVSRKTVTSVAKE